MGRRQRPGRQERAAQRRIEDVDDEGVSEGDGNEPLDARVTSLFRAAAARANYLALDRPELSFASKELCRRMSSPRQCDLWELRRVCRFLRGAPRVVYEFPWQAEGGALQVYADTDFAGCLATRRSTSGGCALIGRHLVKHWSATQKCVTLSSGEAELGGLVKACGEGLGLVSLDRDLDLPLGLQSFADSSAATGICRRSGIAEFATWQ